MLKTVSFLFFFFICLNIFPHGDLDEKIIAVTKEIKIHPDSSYLYFKRGKLYFQHEDYQKSIKDLRKSETQGYISSEQRLIFSKNFYRLNNYDAALNYCEKVLDSDLTNVRVLRMKAKTLMKLKHYKNSALTFEQLLRYTKEAFPENYIETASAWEATNTPEGYDNATIVIEDGIAKLGNIVSLQDILINLALKQNNYKKAIEVQQQIVSVFPRKERAYFKLCELYMLDNDTMKAKESLVLSKKHFYKLPLRIQNTTFMKKLLDGIIAKEILFQPNKF